MKGIRLHPAGGAEALVSNPIPAACDVLVRVHAVAVSAPELTWPATEGQARQPGIPGRELSGVVEDIRGKVSGIAVGDAVYGLADRWRGGAAADYVRMRASELAPKPRTVDHVGAALVSSMAASLPRSYCSLGSSGRPTLEDDRPTRRPMRSRRRVASPLGAGRHGRRQRPKAAAAAPAPLPPEREAGYR